MAKKEKKSVGKSLIIVESPNKISSISKYAGPDYVVKASVGHIRELGGAKVRGMGIDFKNQYNPTFSIIPGKESVIADLRLAAKSCDRVLIATDADREGEAIGWHVLEMIKSETKSVRRMIFTEITSGAIQNALKEESLSDLNMDLVEAQIARQILDKVIGFKVSPILWIAIKDRLSAGRVQSVALRFLVEREAEIQKFKPEEYWYLDADLTTSGSEPLQVRYGVKESEQRIWGKKENVDKIVSSLGGCQWKVSRVESKETSRSPGAPFSTSTLQQTAATQFGWTPKKTMEVAQKLYEGQGSGGLITYHRTDSLSISKEATTLARIYIKNQFGANYLPKSVPDYAGQQRAKKKKKAEKSGEKGGVQFESHEAVRPTDINKDPSTITDPDHQKLYELIWRRFLSSQMTPSKFDSATIEVKAGSHRFFAKGSRLIFDGWLKIWTYNRSEDTLLPSVAQGEILDLQKLSPSQHETKPPERFTSSSIVKLLEEKGIGRPSTYASIIDTLQKREYVALKNKSFQPTDLGISVCNHLVTCDFDFMDPKFTAIVEEALDEIAQGELKRFDVIDLFYKKLLENLKKAHEIQDESEKTDFKCPKCSRSLLLKTSRKGRKFFGCSGYSDKEKKCDNIMKLGEGGEPEEIVVETTGKQCPKCGGNIIKRDGRFGDFYACDNYPACRSIFDESGKLKEKPKPKSAGITCEKCGSDMVIRTNRRDGSDFAACSGYPKCKNTQAIQPKGKTK